MFSIAISFSIVRSDYGGTVSTETVVMLIARHSVSVVSKMTKPSKEMQIEEPQFAKRFGVDFVRSRDAPVWLCGARGEVRASASMPSAPCWQS